MRLTCPNCGAQYEVPDQVIPQEGRDVQCSNCGSTWFQAHPDNPVPDNQPVADDAADAFEEADVGETWEETEEPDLPETNGWPDETPPDENPTDDDLDSEEDWTSEADVGPQEGTGQGAGSRIDADMADVLRQEAEREAQLRAEESSAGLESQPELGLESGPDDARRRAEEARARMARLRGDTQSPQPAAPEPEDDPDNISRRGLLPDIEEINSSLKSSTAVAPALSRSEAQEAEQSKTRNGFSRGFALVMLIGVVLLLIYTNAPRISAALPQADPALNAYVAFVDNARTWLNQKMAMLIPKS